VDKELTRKEELTKSLDYICHQVGQLEVVDAIPPDLEQLDIVINRAIDVRSAAMRYLASQIQHDATKLGTTGTDLIYCFVC
jgi:hypothetical protein